MPPRWTRSTRNSPQAASPPKSPRDEHGRYTFYFKAPGGFTVEVNAFR